MYRIEVVSFPHPYDLSVFQAYMMRAEEAGFDGFLVAKDGDAICGYVIFEYGRTGLIVSMAVKPETRRRKVGSMLLAEALRRLAQRCREVTLQVDVSNREAQELYRRFGFSVEGLLRHYYPDGNDAFLMVKR